MKGREFDGIKTEFQMCIAATPKYWCTTEELGKLWMVKINLIEKGYWWVTELRGIDVGHKVL